MISLRKDNFGNVKITSKYVAGMKSGGEFFDVLQRSGRTILFLSSASSYGDSSIILSHFENLHNEKDLSDQSLEKFMAFFYEETSNNNWKSLNKVQLFLMEINYASLLAFGYNLGGTEVLSGAKQLLPGNQFSPSGHTLDEARFEFSIAGIKKMAVISPGLKKNYQSVQNEKKLREIILEKKEESDENLATMVFSVLKKEGEDDFLEYDGSLILVEVGKNV